MDPILLREQLTASGVVLPSIWTNHMPVFTQLALAWERSNVFKSSINRLFIDGSGFVLDSDGIKELRLLAKAHENFRIARAPMAPAALLKLISSDRVGTIEMDQMPLSAQLAQKLKEAQQRLVKDDYSAIVALKDYGIDLNQKDRDGITLLAFAAQSGAERCIFSLCKNGANPHLADSMGNTALHWACAMSKTRAGAILMYHGANVNAVNHMGASPLMLALARTDIELAKKLLDYNAELRIKDRKGNTALHRAIISKNVVAVRFLLDQGAALDDLNSDGQSALGLAMRIPEITGLVEPYRRELLTRELSR